MISRRKAKLIVLLLVIVACVILGCCSCWKALFYTLLVFGFWEIVIGLIVGTGRIKGIIAFIFGGFFLTASLIIALCTNCLQ